MVITIGGKYGCGGKAVADKLAELLGYKLCNDEIITEAVKDSPFDMAEETFRYFDESQGKAPLSEIEALSGVQRSTNYSNAIKALSYDVVPLDRAMNDIQSAVLNKFADEGNCILLGRCADYYLGSRDDVITVLVTDDDENCIRRIMDAYPELSEKDARKLIKKTNRRREDYYCFFAGKGWCIPDNYAVTLNCALLGGADRAAELLAGAVRAAEKI